MGISILIEKYFEDEKYVVYKYGLSKESMEKLRINKKTLELTNFVEDSEITWNYGYFKAGSFIIKDYQQKGEFPDKVTCAS